MPIRPTGASREANGRNPAKSRSCELSSLSAGYSKSLIEDRDADRQQGWTRLLRKEEREPGSLRKRFNYSVNGDSPKGWGSPSSGELSFPFDGGSPVSTWPSLQRGVLRCADWVDSKGEKYLPSRASVPCGRALRAFRHTYFNIRVSSCR